MAKRVEFGDRSAAKEIRENPKFRPFLAENDDARESAVKLKENVPERALQDITGEAADSRRYEAEQYGQAELTDREKKDLDFSRTNVMHARSAKAIARGKGVDDWTAYYDPTLETDELRDVFDRASRDERGRRGLGRDPDSEEAQIARQARAHSQVKEGELEHAKGSAFQGDREAQDFLQERVAEPGGSIGDVYDISFRRDDGRIRGGGRDYDRLEDVHEDRPQRAQTLDEKRQSGQVTRDPVEWVRAPNRFDYPGIDTVQPRELHDDRSPQARAVDERSAAPLADSREEWALNPGLFDWPGVDDADPERLHAARSQRARTIDEQEIAPVADSKQQWARNPQRWDWPGVDMPATYGPTYDEPVPSAERNTDAPEPFTTALSQQDVSLAPEEAFEGVGAVGLFEQDDDGPWAAEQDVPVVDPGLEADRLQREREAAGVLDENGPIEDARNPFF